MPRLRSLPIRVRLVLAFSSAMAIALTAIGLFVYLNQQDDLDRQIDRELGARLAGVVAIVVDDGDDLGDPARDPLDRVDDEGFVQVLGGDGDVAGASTDALATDPLVDPGTLDRLLSGEQKTADVTPPTLGTPVRVEAERTRDDGLPYFVIVAASLEQRNQTISNLRNLLLVGGPIALLLASLAAYAVASAALRPVDSMRARAEEISADEPGRRLPIPEARDEVSALGETLNAMLDRLERSFERERAFVSDASHELRTPLTILKAEIDLALASGRSPEELERALVSAGEETDRLVQLSEDLLVLARADDGRLPIKARPLDVSELTERVARRFAPRAGELGRTIGVAGPELRVEADSARLEQALSNLVDNSLRYGEGSISIEAADDPAGFTLSVTDQGSGIPESLRETAFGRFVRADTAGSRGGAGLGLAIVSAIASAHGGHVTLGEPGTALVTIVLPH